MSKQVPPEGGHPTRGPESSPVAHRRALPGSKTAAVAFVLTVLLGGGGVAIAKWNQSATVSMEITAGAAATTPAPTPAGPGNIVANPVIAQRPATVDAVSCNSPGNSGKYTISWSGGSATGARYFVSLSPESAAAPTLTKTVDVPSVDFTLDNKATSYGNYLLRIQGITGNVAGDPAYVTLQHQKNSQMCFGGTSQRNPPLGTFSFIAATAPDVKQPTSNNVTLSWTAATKATPGTIYKVTVTSTTTASSYGTEFTTTTPGATLTFPPRVWDAGGWNVQNAGYYGQYQLRIQPLDGDQTGDPVYKTLQYNTNDFTVW